ncbi:MAG: DUF4143 domain-containing protein [Actinomycetota bacterium]|nr:DUF4143 domain-containing protein [Actinomycetota bacterium]
MRLTIYPMTIREQIGRLDEPSFFDKLAAGQDLTVPSDSPDVRGYIALALQSGFPFAALQLSGQARQDWLESYIDDLLTHDIEQLEERKRDRERLRRYFEAYALNSAGVTDHKSIYEKAGVSKATATAYDDLLTGLLIIEQVPAWTSNRLKRLQKQPKRYLIDPALIAAALRMNEQGVLRDGDLLGRVLDTFVAAQLRPELRVSETRPRLYHLRQDKGEHEVDLLVELGGERLIGLEIKATAAPKYIDAKHLIWLRNELNDRFIAGVVFHTGPRLFMLDDKIIAAPISVLWG